MLDLRGSRGLRRSVRFLPMGAGRIDPETWMQASKAATSLGINRSTRDPRTWVNLFASIVTPKER